MSGFYVARWAQAHLPRRAFWTLERALATVFVVREIWRKR